MDNRQHPEEYEMSDEPVFDQIASAFLWLVIGGVLGVVLFVLVILALVALF